MSTLAPLRIQTDERAARQALRDQIERLEEELVSLLAPGPPVAGRGPRLLGLAELERVRDGLAHRVAFARRRAEEQGRAQEELRGRIEAMLLEPEKHRWVRISNADIGEPGCHHVHVRPRLGVLGMLMKWWRVVISSGCPLRRPQRRNPNPLSSSSADSPRPPRSGSSPSWVAPS